MFSPRESTPSDPAAEAIYGALGQYAGWQEYRRAFREITGLSVALRPVRAGMSPVPWPASDDGETDRDCVCRFAGRDAVPGEPTRRTPPGPAGSTDSSHVHECCPGVRQAVVPVRAERGIVAWLVSAPSRSERPGATTLAATLAQARRRGVPAVELPALARVYQSQPVLSDDTFRAAVILLTVFARHLEFFAARVQGQGEVVRLAPAERARRWVETHYAQPLTLSGVGRQVGLSGRHLSEVFHRTMGVTFRAHLARVRIAHAQTLLGHRHLRVAEVAARVGFGSSSQFGRTFRSLVGCSPASFRARAPKVPAKSEELLRPPD